MAAVAAMRCQRGERKPWATHTLLDAEPERPDTDTQALAATTQATYAARRAAVTRGRAA